jgi:hypothetical protein
MKGKLVALAATVTMSYAPGAQAQTTPSLDGNAALPQTIQLPATVRGKGVGGPQQTNLDFTINEFTRGKHGTLCAVGTLKGGVTNLTETPVSIPASANGARANPSDCQGGDDDHEGGFGMLEHPRLNGATPAAAGALALAQPAPFHGLVGGEIVQAQICTILDLILNPIHLDLLGLVVDTSRIRVTITGNPAGGLLGNLLCALLGP